MGIEELELKNIPNKNKVIEFSELVRNYLFPGSFKKVYSSKLLSIKCHKYFNRYISKDKHNEAEFFNKLNTVYNSLLTDIEAAFNGDPACTSKKEVLISYPGFYAITIYRIAHILYELDLKIVARIISEDAHSKTGIDINPGATIGDYFFIDHGTGIVIGETTIIGNNVRIYQGVTLGALSLKEGQLMKGQRRHPTIKDNVIIYAGASILGGDTIIESNITIGSNVFITKSILEQNTKVLNKEADIILKENK